MFALAILTTTRPDAADKRLIYYGWGTPDTTYVAANCRDVQASPFDGIGIQVAVDRKAWRGGATDTGNQLGWNVLGPRRLNAATFEPAARDVRSCGWKGRDDFLPVALSSPGQDHGFSWFDDRRWETIVHNWEVAVAFARQSGLRGLIVDPEHYGPRFFDPVAMRERADRDADQYRTRARERGRTIMEATRRIFPNITILCLFGHTLARRQASYELWGAFLDGLLDAASDEVTIVDGYEFAYGFKTAEEFLDGRADIRAASGGAREQVGFGLWLDYRGPARWRPSDVSANYFTPDAFGYALEQALVATDRYVWVYTQAPRFFPRAAVAEAYIEAMRHAQRAAASRPAVVTGRR